MDNIRDIVNGTQLVRFVHKPVSIMGKVKKVSPNGNNFEIQAVDDVGVLVHVKQPVNSPITDHWVEVRGVSTGKAVDADDYTIFSNKEFDAKSHNTLCQLLYSVLNLWETDFGDGKRDNSYL
ncbi:hypothetical protein GWI33_000099 [Rhynchophorus ferrugineus]|uniref:Replication factor A protein 3 n=1 Tax=Rhynchophorus ferrugineus TaxID=354439 RepID=A0A834MNT6_RHYFE|nr:hypothetical protein GWI33_000099 [Rhynchophorus ferrugineus]